MIDNVGPIRISTSLCNCGEPFYNVVVSSIVDGAMERYFYKYQKRIGLFHGTEEQAFICHITTVEQVCDRLAEEKQ